MQQDAFLPHSFSSNPSLGYHLRENFTCSPYVHAGFLRFHLTFKIKHLGSVGYTKLSLGVNASLSAYFTEVNCVPFRMFSCLMSGVSRIHCHPDRVEVVIEN